MKLFLILCLFWPGIGFPKDSHDGPVPRLTEGGERSIANGETASHGLGLITRCGPTPPKSTMPTSFIYAMVTKSPDGFLKADPDTQNSFCAPLAIRDGELLGMVEPLKVRDNENSYTVVPGEMIGKKAGVMYVMIPSLDPAQPPHWVVAPCDMQVQEALRLALILEKGRTAETKMDPGRPKNDKELRVSGGDEP